MTNCLGEIRPPSWAKQRSYLTELTFQLGRHIANKRTCKQMKEIITNWNSATKKIKRMIELRLKGVGWRLLIERGGSRKATLPIENIWAETWKWEWASHSKEWGRTFQAEPVWKGPGLGKGQVFEEQKKRTKYLEAREPRRVCNRQRGERDC